MLATQKTFTSIDGPLFRAVGRLRPNGGMHIRQPIYIFRPYHTIRDIITGSSIRCRVYVRKNLIMCRWELSQGNARTLRASMRSCFLYRNGLIIVLLRSLLAVRGWPLTLSLFLLPLGTCPTPSSVTLVTVTLGYKGWRVTTFVKHMPHMIIAVASWRNVVRRIASKSHNQP